MNETKLIQTAKQYLPESREQIEQWLAGQAVSSEEPIVVVYGVYNAGKSSLLNSLTGHVEREFFATREIPETKKNQALVHDGICYLDTPGLDVNAQDTRTAIEGSRQADLIILVHRLGAGSIQKLDLQAMKELVDARGHDDRVLAVLTEGETANRNKSLIAEITQQLRSIIPGCTPFVVSNTSFRKGMLEGKQVLVHSSGIPQLLGYLRDITGRISLELARTRDERQTELKQGILRQLRERLEELELLLDIEDDLCVMYEHRFIEAVQSIQLRLRQDFQKHIHASLDD